MHQGLRFIFQRSMKAHMGRMPYLGGFKLNSDLIFEWIHNNTYGITVPAMWIR